MHMLAVLAVWKACCDQAAQAIESNDEERHIATGSNAHVIGLRGRVSGLRARVWGKSG